MKPQGNGDNPWRAAGLVGAMGLDIAVCTLLGYWIGNWMGGSKLWAVSGLLVGMAVGIVSAAFLIKKVMEGSHD